MKNFSLNCLFNLLKTFITLLNDILIINCTDWGSQLLQSWAGIAKDWVLLQHELCGSQSRAWNPADLFAHVSDGWCWIWLRSELGLLVGQSPFGLSVWLGFLLGDNSPWIVHASMWLGILLGDNTPWILFHASVWSRFSKQRNLQPEEWFYK